MKLGVALLGVAAVGAWFFTGSQDDDAPGGFTAPAVTAILVDTSASSTRGRQGWKRWVIRTVQQAAQRAKGRGDDLALVTFDSKVTRRTGPVNGETFFDQLRRQQSKWLDLTDADLETDFRGAAEVAAALLSEPGRGPGRIVVLGDGVPTGPDPSATLLQDPDWVLELLPPPPRNRVDLGVVYAVAPREVAPDVAVPIELDCVLVGPNVDPGARVIVDWRLEVTGTDGTTRGRELGSLDGWPRASESTTGGTEFLSGTVRHGAAELVLPATACAAASSGVHSDLPRPFRIRFSVPGTSEGSARLHARVRLKAVESDPFPENDGASTRWRVGDPVRVVVCAPPSAMRSATEIFGGPAFDGIEFHGVSPERLGAMLSVEPAKLPDVVVTVELAFGDLPAQALATFVEERGGGWLHSAGWPLAGVEDPLLSPLAALELDRTPKPPRDIVFFVDGSGSMEGERWRHMRDALRKLMPSVPVTDTLSLRFFTRSMGDEELRLEPQLESAGSTLADAAAAERGRALKRLLRMRVPGGATDIVSSLVQLASSRESREHSVPIVPGAALQNDGLVVLISDGETRSAKSRRKAVRAMLTRNRDGFVAIHVGDGKGVRFLEGLLIKGEEVILVDAIDGLLDHLQEALHELRVTENARLTAAAPAVESGGGVGAVDVSDEWSAVLQGVQDRIPVAEPTLVGRALPARPTPGAVGLADLVSEALTVSGRSPTFAAAALRGRGLTAGLAAPLVVEGADERAGRGSRDGEFRAWVPGVVADPGWVAPLFRLAAQRRDAADVELAGPTDSAGPRAQWLPDSRLAFGSDTPRQGAVVLVEDLGFDVPARLEAVFQLAGDGTAAVAGNGAGKLGRAPAEYVPSARDPRTVRAIQVPQRVWELPPGTDVIVTLTRASASHSNLGEVMAGPFQIQAPGPDETSPAVAGRQAAVFRASRGASEAAGGPKSTVTGQLGGADQQDGRQAPLRRGHPIVPWLLLTGLLALFSGCALATRGR